MVRVRTILAVLALAGALTAPGRADYVNKEFPVFQATDALEKRRFSLDDYRGHVVLLDFWATWCGPCVGEIPNLRAVHEKYRDRGLVVISISLDKDEQKCLDFARRQKMQWLHVIEGGGWDTRLAKKYGVRSIPSVFLIDHRGICISDRARGPALEQLVSAAIAKLPAAPAPADEAPTGREKKSTRAQPGETGTDPAAVAAARERVAAARDRLDAAAAPLVELTARLNECSAALAALEVDVLNVADAPDLTGPWRKLHEDLVAVRRDLFVRGFLDEQRVVLPPDPVGPPTRTALATARAAVQALQGATGDLAKRLDLAEAGLKRAETQSSGRRGVADPTERCAEAEALAAVLGERFDGAWRRQLASLDRVLAGLVQKDGGLAERLERIEALIESCRADLATAGRSSSASLTLRENFTTLCRDVKAVCEEAVRQGALSSLPGDLPENPLSGGPIRDARTRVEAGAALDRAAAAVASVRGALGGGGERLGAFDERIKAMQQELASSDGDAAALADLQKRFAALCGEILSALDGR